MAKTGRDIHEAAELLKSGKTVAIPTETVYGLAANALDPIAVARIFEIKKRPFFDPLIVHTFSLQKAEEYVSEFSQPLRTLAERFWPGPLTLLLPRKNNIPDLVTAGLDRVGVRVPDNALTLALLKQLDFPLAAPSANPFGYVSPTTPEHVEAQLGNQIEFILDDGPCKVGLESTIVGMDEGKVCIYRLGGLAIEEIEKVTGRTERRLNTSSDPLAPGQLKSHYAPSKKLLIGNIAKHKEENKGKKIGLIAFGSADPAGAAVVINLSEKGDLKEAASNLFSALRKMDESEVDVILCDHVPETGLGSAINDRLKRASVKL